MRHRLISVQCLRKPFITSNFCNSKLRWVLILTVYVYIHACVIYECDLIKIKIIITQLLSSDDLWMYAPIAFNGMDIGLNSPR